MHKKVPQLQITLPGHLVVQDDGLEVLRKCVCGCVKNTHDTNDVPLYNLN